MDLQQLTYFLHTAEAQSFSRAAAMLRVAQPTLSRQIKALEEDLGVQLLSRHGWGVLPTATGRVFMEHVRRVLREVELARDAVLAYQSEPSGRLSLGVPTSIGLVLLPRLASSFRRSFPKVTLHLVEGFSASIHAWVLTGQLDLAILYDTKAAMSGLVLSPLLEEEMVMVGAAGRFPPRRTLDQARLQTLDVIVPSRPHRLRVLVDDAYAQHGLRFEPALEVDALPAIMELVRADEGVALLPYSCVHAAVRTGSFSFARLAPAIRRTLVLARPHGRLLTPAMEALEQRLRHLIAGEAQSLRWRPIGSPS